MDVSDKNSRAILNKLLMRTKAQQPAYTYCNVGVRDVPTDCELTLPQLSMDGHVLEPRSFKGSGRNKKDATTSATAAAVKTCLEEDWIRGLLVEPPPAATLAGAVGRALTPEARRD